MGALSKLGLEQENALEESFAKQTEVIRKALMGLDQYFEINLEDGKIDYHFSHRALMRVRDELVKAIGEQGFALIQNNREMINSTRREID